jgi:hypothetical protein
MPRAKTVQNCTQRKIYAAHWATGTFYPASALVEAPRQGPDANERFGIDIYVGMAFSNLVALAIMATTAATILQVDGMAAPQRWIASPMLGRRAWGILPSNRACGLCVAPHARIEEIVVWLL